MVQLHPWRKWRHVVKLDPDRPVTRETLRQISQSGTDAILVGGTQGITYENTCRLWELLQQECPQLPVWQEISNEEAIVPHAIGYGIPVVLNSAAGEWLIGRHAQAISRWREWIPWERVVVEGYIILNGESAAARLTGALTQLTSAEAAAYAHAAERLFHIDTLYIEYSGCYGDVATIREIRHAFSGHLLYGGGIDSYQRAAEMAGWVDTVVVGNALYERGITAVLETIRAVKGCNK